MDIDFKTEFLEACVKTAPEANFVFMDPKEAVFEECVRMNCFYCGKYGRNWRCPPNLPAIDYPKMFSEFDGGLFVYFRFAFTSQAQFQNIRAESSVTLHKTLLQIEKILYQHNRPTAISFGAGSCKLCKGGCGKDRCNNPYLSRSSLEATGVNVVKTAAKFGIEIRFPPEETLMRIGLVLWQNPVEIQR